MVVSLGTLLLLLDTFAETRDVVRIEGADVVGERFAQACVKKPTEDIERLRSRHLGEQLLDQGKTPTRYR